MSAKYTRLPSSDPDSENVAIDFSSIYEYGGQNKNEFKSPFDPAFNCDRISKSKYKSAFTYSGGFDPHQKEQYDVNEVKQSPTCKICNNIVTVLCFFVLAITFPISAWFSLKKIQTYERLVIYRLGRLLEPKGPGMVLTLPCIDFTTKVDLRMKAFSIPPQKTLTSDGAAVEVGAELYYRVKDPVRSVSNVQDLNRSTRVIAESILQKHLCNYELNDINVNKTIISQTLISDINKMTLTWGVEVTRASLSQVKVISDPTQPHGSNPLSLLGPLLFPTGSSNPPLEQLQGLPGFTPQLQPSESAHIPGHTPDIPHNILTQLKQQELEHLKKQYPNLSSEFSRLMKNETETEVPTVQRSVSEKYKSPRDLLKAVVPKLNSQLVREFMCIYKFVVTGPGGGIFYLDLRNHEGDADEGEPRLGTADVTMTLGMNELESLLNGETSAFAAYMTGRIQVEGDMGLASKLSDIVELFK